MRHNTPVPPLRKGLRIVSLLTVAVTLALAACNNAQETRNLATVGGAGAGALAGSQLGAGAGNIVAIGGGIVLGAWLGSELGLTTDSMDQEKAVDAFRTAFYHAPLNQQVLWTNISSDNYGSFTAYAQGVHPSRGWYCRDIKQTVTVGGRFAEKSARACDTGFGQLRIFEQ